MSWQSDPVVGGASSGGGWQSDPVAVPAIDFNRPVEAVRADIAKLPEGQREPALRMWADNFVANERKQGGIGQAIDSTLRTLARGTFVGPLLDEATGLSQQALYSLSGGAAGSPYDEAVAYQRAQDRALDEANPWMTTAGKIVGGVAGGVGAVRAGGGALAVAAGGPLGAAPLAATMPGRIAQGAATGAAYGGVSGFGNAEDGLANRAGEAATGAATGAAIGGVLPPVISGIGAVGGRALDAASPTIARVQQDLRNRGILSTPQPPRSLSAAAADGGGPMQTGADAAAEQMIANQLMRANVSPRDLRARMGEANNAARYYSNSEAQQVLAPVDLDPSLQRLAGSVGRQSPEAANTMQAFQFARQTGQTPNLPLAPDAGLPTRAALARPQPDDKPMGQFERMKDALKRALLIKDKDFHGHAANAYRTEASILKAAKDEAKPAYAAAYKAAEGIDLAPTLAPILQKWQTQLIDEPAPVAAQLQKAMRLFERALSPAGQKSHLERADKVKQWLDDQIERAFTSSNGRQRYLGGKLTEFKNEVVDALDQLPQAGALYKSARDNFSSRMEAREALRLGQSVFREDADVAVDQFNALGSAGLQKLFRLGLLDGFEKQMGRQKRTADVTQIFENPRIQEILQTAIPRSRDATEAVFANRPERFGSFVGNEKSMIATRNEVFGNSKTAQRLADDQAFESLSTVVEQFKQSPSVINVGMKAMETLLNRLFGMRADTAQAISRKLFTADPGERDRLFRALEARMGPNRAAQLASMLAQYQRQVTQASATASGSLPQQ